MQAGKGCVIQCYVRWICRKCMHLCFGCLDDSAYSYQCCPCSAQLLHVRAFVCIRTGDTDGSCIHAVLLLMFGLIASMPTGFLMLYTSFSGVFLLIGGALLIIVMLALAPSYRSASWVFGGYRSGDAEAVGISHWGCVATRSTQHPPGSLRVPCTLVMARNLCGSMLCRSAAMK